MLGDPEGDEFDVIEPGDRFLAGCGFVGVPAGDGSQAVGYFWALGRPLLCDDNDENEETAIRSPEGGPEITRGGPPVEPRHGRNRWAYDLIASHHDDQGEARRLTALGATRLAGGPGGARLADPDGTELRILPPRRPPAPSRHGGRGRRQLYGNSAATALRRRPGTVVFRRSIRLEMKGAPAWHSS